jgi:hypothetical protein
LSPISVMSAEKSAIAGFLSQCGNACVLKQHA